MGVGDQIGLGGGYKLGYSFYFILFKGRAGLYRFGKFYKNLGRALALLKQG